ncbi:MAG: four helix bundle protein [Vicinamibacterales bacterium]
MGDGPGGWLRPCHPDSASHEPRRLQARVFHTADDLMLRRYRASATLPVEERYGLQSQLRRAALSVPLNIVEGSARKTLKEYLSFLNVATASNAEVLYLLTVVRRLGLLEAGTTETLAHEYRALLKSLRAMLRGLSDRA